jgi:raffinose/stachyose/melibiose transport system substrate-binding protein
MNPARHIALLALLAAALIGGCGDDDEPAAAGGGEASGSIRFMTLATSQNADKAMVEQFQKTHPQVKVEAEFIPGGGSDVLAALMTQLQGGKGPDVFIVYGGTGVPPSVSALAKANHVEDLSSAPWAKQVPSPAEPLATVDGRTYMAMLGVQAGVVAYNVAAFEKLGLEPPATWSELISACRTIERKDPGKVPLGFAGGAPGTAAPNLLMLAASDVYGEDPEWNAKRADGSTTFADTPGWRRVFERLEELKSAGCVGEGAAADQFPDTISQFAAEKSLMLIGPTVIASNIRAANPDLEFSVFAPPADTARTTHLMLFPSQGLAVNARASNKAAARAYVDYMAEEKQTARWADVNGVISPYAVEQGDLPEHLEPLEPVVDRAAAGPYLLWPTPTTFVALGTGAQGVLTGQKTIDQALADLDASWGK